MMTPGYESSPPSGAETATKSSYEVRLGMEPLHHMGNSAAEGPQYPDKGTNRNQTSSLSEY